MVDKKISFVLSTGRTGTSALTKLLNTGVDVKAIHEPSPSRRFHILGNFYYEEKIKKDTLANYYFNQREKFWSNIKEGHFIEVNPFIWSVGESICERFDNPKILHIVRDIRTYLVSRINFKAPRWKRYIIDFVPFWNLNVSKPNLEIDNWSSLAIEEQIACRWVFTNLMIEQTSKYTNNYLRIRFEDIFSQKPEIQREALGKISSLFEIEMDIERCIKMLEYKFNASKKRSIVSFDSFDPNLKNSVLQITSNTLEKYNYL